MCFLKIIGFFAALAAIAFLLNWFFPAPTYMAHYITWAIVGYVLSIVTIIFFILYVFYLIGEATDDRRRHRR